MILGESPRTTEWPAVASMSPTPQTTAIVTVNHNTLEHLVLLLWSIHRHLGRDGFGRIIVVDNASTDGSWEVLDALDGAGLLTLIANADNRYHGPALTQAFDHLAGSDNPPTAIWVLDSDCIVVRPDTLTRATATMAQSHAALVGQPVHDIWSNGTFGLHSLLIDPARAWRDPIIAFEEHGMPSQALQDSVDAAGLVRAPFPFTADGFVIHLGRGTLAGIAAREDADNRYFDWARDHAAPHFAEEVGAEATYRQLRRQFLTELPELTPQTIVDALRR